MRKLMVMVLLMLTVLSFTGVEYNTSKVSYYGVEHHGKKIDEGGDAEKKRTVHKGVLLLGGAACLVQPLQLLLQLIEGLRKR